MKTDFTGKTDFTKNPNLPRRTKFNDTEEFYDLDPRRRYSPEADYGLHWRMRPFRNNLRVSYVRDTGEIYAATFDPSEATVFLLGVVPPDPVEQEFRQVYYRTLDTILTGWPQQSNTQNGIHWIVQQVAASGHTAYPIG